MRIRDAQSLVWKIYGKKDSNRGVESTTLWLCEEVGELCSAIRQNKGLEEEIADVLAWLLSVANLLGVDVGIAFAKYYGHGCKKCKNTPCTC